jgi:mRNA-degrading endonuclease RelE of RelBE toxin-antitoxin system
MKPYEVLWDQDAETQLATIFLTSSDPNLLWPAQDRADRKLEQRPKQAGKELSEGLWEIYESPLRIFYEIDDAKKTVSVTHVQIIDLQ